MPGICILTDSTAQFTHQDFPGHELIFVIQMRVDCTDPESTQKQPRLRSPEVQEFTRFFTHLGKEYDGILVLLLSAHLNPAFSNAEKTSRAINNHTDIQVIDSQSTTVGLGMLVQVAAGAASRGATLAEVDHCVRAAIKRVYMLMCIPELTHLVGLGLLTQTQAVVGEILGMQPIFVFEDGSLVPIEKVRTPRHLFESFQEFMTEFAAPGQISLLRGSNHTTLRTRPLRLFVEDTFPGASYSEHALNEHVAVLFGAQSIGLMVINPI